MYREGPRSFLAIIAIVLFATWASVVFRYVGVPGNDWHDAINSDGKGYYEYLRMILFPGDPDMHTGDGVLHPAVQAPVIKHFGGAAAAMAPFVLIAHTYTLLKPDAVEDGYSLHYQIAVGLAALCWLTVGLFALRKWLLACGISDAAIAITLVLLSLGTGLITQAVVHPAMSHVYGFAVVALLLWNTRRLLLTPRPAILIGCAALLAWATWIRPVDLLVVLALPLCAFNIAGDRTAPLRSLHARHVSLAVLVFAAILSLQGFAWYLQSGSFLAKPYPYEGFHWSQPAMLRSLFSPRNGLLFYWPVLALVVPGIVALWKRSQRMGATLVLFLLPFAYVTAGWWNWAYGDNFGQRTYLDMLPVLALPVASIIPAARMRRVVLVVCCVPLLLLNLFQSWQYHSNLLVTGQMDLRKYKHLFLTTDPRHALAVGGHEDLPLYSATGTMPLPLSWVQEEHGAALWTDGTGGEHVAIMYAPLPAEAIPVPLYVQVAVERTEQVPGSSADARVGLLLRRNGVARPVHAWRMNVVPNAGPVAHWDYAFNVMGHEEGDTLFVTGTLGGPAWQARVTSVSVLVPR